MTTPDLLRLTLAAIESEEASVHGMEHRRAHTDECDWWGDMPGYCTCDSKERVLRRCAADRKLIALHPQDPELGWLCQLCGGEGQNLDCTYPCDTLRLIAESYGVTPAEEDARG